jgi:hypothetical protein
MPLRHRPSTPPLMPGTPAAGIGDLSGSLVCSSEAGEPCTKPERLRKGRGLRPYNAPVKVTRADWGFSGWELQPMKSARRLPYSRRLAAQEMEVLVRGFHPREMEDHWFIFEEDGVVHLHRSWTGIEFCAFQLHPLADGGAEITEVMVNEASEELRPRRRRTLLRRARIEDDLDEFETRSAHILDVFFDSISGTPWPEDRRGSLESVVYGLNVPFV